MRKRLFTSALLLLTTFAFHLLSSTPAYARLAAPQTQAATPETVVDEPLFDWTIGGSLLYWGDRCPPGPDIVSAGVDSTSATYLLRRMPLNGGTARTLDTSMDVDCANFQYMVADGKAIYYYNQSDRLIEKVPVGAPNAGPKTVADVGVGGFGPTTDLKIKDGMLYYGISLGQIMRVPVTGGTPQLVVETSHIPNDIEFQGDRMYWIDRDGVWTVQLPCDPCQRIEYSNKGGFFLASKAPSNIAGSGTIFWVVPGDGATVPSRIYHQVPVINGVSDHVAHTAPLGYLIGDPKSVPTGFLFGQSSTYWVETRFGEQDLLRRDGDIIDAVDGKLHHHIDVVGNDVYYARTDADNQAILRIPKDAEALKRDMTIAAIEVTQAVQNLENGVPLIADKQSYVRVYGQQVDGALKSGVEAWLEGSRNGQPLPGSPLAALNGEQPLITGEAIDRGPEPDAKGDWLFRLPRSWAGEGDLVLRAVVDPRGAYADTNPANNALETTVHFDHESEPCLVFYPILTHAPLPHHTDPIFWQVMDRLTSLWPVDGLNVLWVGEPIRELELCWDWDGHCWGPYELNQGWEVTNFPPDSDRVLAKLMLRQATSRIQSLLYCDDIASVHTVGMVHEESDTGTTGGYANFLINASWVKFKNSESNNNRRWNQPTSGAVMAQELTHNFWRYHIGCLDAEDSFLGLGDWPYEDRCKIDDRPFNAASTHYGFDPISHQIIQPDRAADFMTYRSARWVSDFTFKDVKDILGGLFGLDNLDAALTAAGTSAPQQGDSLLLSGVYESISGAGRFFYSYVLPPDMLTEVATGEPPSEVSAAQVHHGPQAEPDAHIRILGLDNALLAEYQIDLIAPDNHDENYAAYYFLAQLPKPEAAIGRMELIVEGELVHAITPSANAPEIEILSPTTNETLGDEITLRWRATDADGDVLLFTVNYSPDGGTSWLPLVTEHPGDVENGVESAVTSLTLESPDTLPGSSAEGGFLRVIASDGFHTAVAEAGPFVVEDRLPVAIIQAPDSDEWFDPTQPILLRGLGYDAEAGLMDDAALEWSIDGETIGTGRQQAVVGLAPGTHRVELKVMDRISQSNTIEGVVNVLPLSVDVGTSLSLDGRCNDAAYVTPLPLDGYAGGGNATLYLARRGDDLWACLSALSRVENVLSEAALRLDVNASRDDVALASDYLFLLGEDGSPQAFTGDGAGLFNQSAEIEFGAQVAATETAWSAEYRIPATSIMLWDGSFGIAVDHANESEHLFWPLGAEANAPRSWAEVAAEQTPYIDAIAPGSLTVGDPEQVLTVDGTRFTDEATLLWDGVAQSTFISSTRQLTVPLTSALLTTAGEIELTVVNSTSSAYMSNPVKLLIHNRTPSIGGLSPATADAGAAARTVTITGQDFVDGSVALWDGDPRPTRFVNATTLEMDLIAADLKEEQAWGVTVLAPQPRLAASNTVDFVVGEPGSAQLDEALFLPIMVK